MGSAASATATQLCCRDGVGAAQTKHQQQGSSVPVRLCLQVFLVLGRHLLILTWDIPSPQEAPSGPTVPSYYSMQPDRPTSHQHGSILSVLELHTHRLTQHVHFLDLASFTSSCRVIHVSCAPGDYSLHC